MKDFRTEQKRKQQQKKLLTSTYMYSDKISNMNYFRKTFFRMKTKPNGPFESELLSSHRLTLKSKGRVKPKFYLKDAKARLTYFL